MLRQLDNRSPNSDREGTHVANYGAGDRRGGRVLMLATAFPPTGGSGVQRTAKFVKYLPGFGWHPIVWTTDRVDDLPYDPTLLDDLPPDADVRRWRGGLRGRLVERWVQSIRRFGSAGTMVADALGWRLRKWNNDRGWPDEFIGWAHSSVSSLLRLIERERIDVIYSTYSPISNHVLGSILQSRTGLPWVADFRDLWTDDFRYRVQDKTQREEERRLEQQILESADAVIGVSRTQATVLSDHVPDARGKFVTITNGFDATDFEGVTRFPDRSKERFVMAFVGRFDRYRVTEDLLAGFAKFVRRLGDRRDRFVLRIVGHISDRTRRNIASTGVGHEYVSYVDHGTAVREMVSADALLLSRESSGPNADSVICGKTFEYLASGRPILAVVPEGGESDRLVRRCDAGLTVTFDEELIAKALERLFRAWEEGRSLAGCPSNRLEPFSRIALTGRLAKVLDDLASSVNATRETEQNALMAVG